MPFSRRKFLQQGTLAALVCAGPWRAWSANRNGSGNSGSQAHITGKVSGLSRRFFEGAVGSNFKVSTTVGSTQPAWLLLAAVHDLPALAPVNTGAMAVPPPKPSSPPVTTEGFMLSFTGGPSTGLAQGTYLFEHDGLGQFQLFIVPEGRSPEAYTAVFNQVEAAAAVAGPPSQLPGRSRAGNAPGAGAGVTSPGNASSGNAGSDNAGGSGAGQPAQQPLEPVFNQPLRFRLPE
jgi:uncharacterized protein DUF6916